METISLAGLRRIHACENQQEKFKQIFGSGPVDITDWNARVAGSGGLSCRFLLKILSPQARRAYERKIESLKSLERKLIHRNIRMVREVDPGSRWTDIEEPVRCMVNVSRMAALVPYLRRVKKPL